MQTQTKPRVNRAGVCFICGDDLGYYDTKFILGYEGSSTPWLIWCGLLNGDKHTEFHEQNPAAVYYTDG